MKSRECNFNSVSAISKTWEDSRTIPMWMKYYIFWHKIQLQQLDETNWNAPHRQYYILHCLKDDTTACGGASDRLQQVPYALRHAYETSRIFFIKWEKPAPLEEFLEPPPGGLDWRLPQWLDAKLPWSDRKETNGLLVGKVGPVDMTQGAEKYDASKNTNEAPYHIMFHDCWMALFRPVPPIQAIIDRNLRQLGLAPGAYVAVHIRSKYLDDNSDKIDFIRNAVSCGLQLQPGQPIFVASDSNAVLKEATCFKPGNSLNRQENSFSQPVIVSRQGRCPSMSTNTSTNTPSRIGEPLHLDNGDNFLCTGCANHYVSARDYYDTFVDLYLLASGGCVVAGRGGYGVWASRMSTNASCLMFHADQDPGSGNKYFSKAKSCTSV